LRRHAGDLSEGIAAGDQAPGRLAPLVERYEGALAARRHPPLLLICALSLDFLVAHPFEIGSGRMTRLLVIHELLRHDYEVARYISLERRILDTTSEHDAALQASREPDGRLDPLPWARYLLSTVAAAYAELEARLAADGELLGMSKRDQARSYVLAHAPQRFPLAQMDIALPDISRATVRDALQQLCREGRLRVDAGPSAMWERIG
jgi:Fic family protein